MNKKAGSSIALDIVAILFYIGIIVYVKVHLNTLTTSGLFISFTMIPALLVLLVPFFGTLLWNDKKRYILNFVFTLIIFVGAYVIVDSFFTENVIAHIYANSNIDSSISVNTNTDISNIISTILMMFGLCAFGTFIASKIRKGFEKKRSNA